MIGHSAGGWLARVYMEEFGFDGIALLLTLGSPHSYAFPLISCVAYALIASLLGPVKFVEMLFEKTFSFEISFIASNQNFCFGA